MLLIPLIYSHHYLLAQLHCVPTIPWCHVNRELPELPYAGLTWLTKRWAGGGDGPGVDGGRSLRHGSTAARGCTQNELNLYTHHRLIYSDSRQHLQTCCTSKHVIVVLPTFCNSQYFLLESEFLVIVWSLCFVALSRRKEVSRTMYSPRAERWNWGREEICCKLSLSAWLSTSAPFQHKHTQ